MFECWAGPPPLVASALPRSEKTKAGRNHRAYAKPFTLGLNAISLQAERKNFDSTLSARLDLTPASAAHSVERRQVAALPHRRTAAGDIEILLTTLRETKRYIPKGWPILLLSDSDAAAQEEAGVRGKIKRK
jgi:hypothetical protein